MRHQSDAPELRAHFRGEIIAAGDDRYEEARKLYNGMIDKHPRLIARCADVADVVAAVNFGREHELLIAVRGGGHNGGGLGSCDDGLVIDLALMKGVRIDPETRTVRVGPGCYAGRGRPCNPRVRACCPGRHRLGNGYFRSRARGRPRLFEPPIRTHDRQSD